ncbi:MFS transporter [Halovenus sp. WSH3]|uniref:MFS transporter n=1 Tax=Halovenus carboxidivorans TaxID=2692199 RepID=A0A6B0SYW5_9EURY|nr:MFS transporter [Halovenus carboxidivorans]
MSDTDRAVLGAVVFAVLFAQVLLYPGIPDLVVALDASPAGWNGDVGAILSAGKWFLTAEFAGFVLCAGLWGALSDATGRRTPLVAAGAILGGVGYLSLAVAPRVVTVPYEVVLVVRFLQGVATIGAFSLAITTLMDLDGGHGRNMGAAGLAIGLGTAVGSPVGGQLYGLGPFVPLYVAAAVLFAVGGLATVASDRTSGRSRRLRAAVETLWRRRSLAVPFAFGFVDRLTAGFFALVGTVYFQSELGLDPGGTGLLLGAFFVPFALLQYPFGRLSDRIGRVLPVAAGSLAYGLTIVGVFYAPTVPTAGVAMVLVGVTGALVAPATMALVTDLASGDERGVAMGGFNVFGSLGFLTGIVGGATVAGRVSFEAAFLAVGLAEVVIAVVAVPFLLGLDLPASGLRGQDLTR